MYQDEPINEFYILYFNTLSHVMVSNVSHSKCCRSKDDGSKEHVICILKNRRLNLEAVTNASR